MHMYDKEKVCIHAAFSQNKYYIFLYISYSYSLLTKTSYY